MMLVGREEGRAPQAKGEIQLALEQPLIAC
jgi:hypothetical protein